MKKLFITLTTVCMIFAFLCTPYFASFRSFGGTVDYNWTRVSNQTTKDTSDALMGIDWTYTNKTSHKLWFQCRNSNGQERAKILISAPNLGKQYISTTAKRGYYYYLYAGREHIIDPSTYVSGYWQP